MNWLICVTLSPSPSLIESQHFTTSDLSFAAYRCVWSMWNKWTLCVHDLYISARSGAVINRWSIWVMLCEASLLKPRWFHGSFLQERENCNESLLVLVSLHLIKSDQTGWNGSLCLRSSPFVFSLFAHHNHCAVTAHSPCDRVFLCVHTGARSCPDTSQPMVLDRRLRCCTAGAARPIASGVWGAPLFPSHSCKTPERRSQISARVPAVTTRDSPVMDKLAGWSNAPHPAPCHANHNKSKPRSKIYVCIFNMSSDLGTGWKCMQLLVNSSALLAGKLGLSCHLFLWGDLASVGTIGTEYTDVFVN